MSEPIYIIFLHSLYKPSDSSASGKLDITCLQIRQILMQKELVSINTTSYPMSEVVNHKNARIYLTYSLLPIEPRFLRSADTHIICVNLDDNSIASSLEKKIAKLRKSSPTAEFAIIGIGDNQENVAQLSKLCLENNSTYMSYKFDLVEREKLVNRFITPLITQKNSEEAQYEPCKISDWDELNTEIKLLENDSKKVEFKQSLEQLAAHLKQKPLKDTNAASKTISATLTMLKTLKNSEKMSDDKITKVFQTYLKSCPHTQNQSNLLSKLIKTVAITGICTLVGVGLAAGICLSLGLGLGVGAAIAASAAATGLFISGTTFFRQNDSEKVIKNVADTGMKAYHSLPEASDSEDNLDDKDSFVI